MKLDDDKAHQPVLSSYAVRLRDIELLSPLSVRVYKSGSLESKTASSCILYKKLVSFRTKTHSLLSMIWTKPDSLASIICTWLLSTGVVTNIAIPVTSDWSKLPAAAMSVVFVQVELQLIVAKPHAIQEKNKCRLHHTHKTSAHKNQTAQFLP